MSKHQQNVNQDIKIDLETKIGTKFTVTDAVSVPVINLLTCDLTFVIPNLKIEVNVAKNGKGELKLPPPGEYRYAVEADCIEQLSGPLVVT